MDNASTADPKDEAAARLAGINDFFADKVPGMFGMRFTQSGPEGTEGELTVTDALIAGTGFLFAPVVVGLADILCAGGIGWHLPAGSSFTTIEIKTNFLGSARTGELVQGRAWPSHVGRTTQVWDAEVTNATTGKTMALFRNTQLVLAARRD